MHALVHAADIQDRDGGGFVMATLFGLYPFLMKLYADGGYQGAGFQSAVKTVLSQVNVEIVKRSDQAIHRFVVLPKGSLSEHSLGLADAEGWPRTGNVSIRKHSLSSSYPPSA